MNQQIHVRACLIVVQEHKILLVPHFDTDVGPIQYNIPGGRVEFGETLEEAAVREFKEETGFEASCHGLFDIYEHIVPDWHSITVGFRGTITGGSIHAEQTKWGERVPRWFSKDDLRNVPYHPQPLINKALRDI